MQCENSFCIYWLEHTCVLEEISLDACGVCESCIYIELDEGLLSQKRKELLKKLEY